MYIYIYIYICSNLRTVLRAASILLGTFAGSHTLIISGLLDPTEKGMQQEDQSLKPSALVSLHQHATKELPGLPPMRQGPRHLDLHVQCEARSEARPDSELQLESRLWNFESNAESNQIRRRISEFHLGQTAFGNLVVSLFWTPFGILFGPLECE